MNYVDTPPTPTRNHRRARCCFRHKHDAAPPLVARRQLAPTLVYERARSTSVSGQEGEAQRPVQSSKSEGAMFDVVTRPVHCERCQPSSGPHWGMFEAQRKWSSPHRRCLHSGVVPALGRGALSGGGAGVLSGRGAVGAAGAAAAAQGLHEVVVGSGRQLSLDPFSLGERFRCWCSLGVQLLALKLLGLSFLCCGAVWLRVAANQ